MPVFSIIFIEVELNLWLGWKIQIYSASKNANNVDLEFHMIEWEV